MKKCKNGKVKYRTEKDAYKAKGYIISHDPSADMLDLLPYTCPVCGFIHLGHRSKHLENISRSTLTAETF